MNEKDFKKKVRLALQAQGLFVMSTFDTHRKGLPDLYVCRRGISVWLELKYQEKQEKLSHPLTSSQSVFLSQIEEAGGVGMVVIGVGNMCHTERIKKVEERRVFEYNLKSFEDTIREIADEDKDSEWFL